MFKKIHTLPLSFPLSQEMLQNFKWLQTIPENFHYSDPSAYFPGISHFLAVKQPQNSLKTWSESHRLKE